MLYEARYFENIFRLCDYLNENNILPNNIVMIQRSKFDNSLGLLFCKYKEEPKPEMMFKQGTKEKT